MMASVRSSSASRMTSIGVKVPLGSAGFLAVNIVMFSSAVAVPWMIGPKMTLQETQTSYLAHHGML